MSETKRIDIEALAKVSGGQTEEEYYEQLEKFGLLDTEEHLLEGKKCDLCHIGKYRFLRYQKGRFGNREAIYSCSLCNEYAVTGLRK